MAGKAVDYFLKHSAPDAGFTMTYFAEGTEIDDAVVGVAPCRLLVIKAFIGNGVDSAGTTNASLKAIPSGTAISAAGTAITDTLSMAGQGNNVIREFVLSTDSDGVPDANIVDAGDAIVFALDGANATDSDLTLPHVTVYCVPLAPGQ